MGYPWMTNFMESVLGIIFPDFLALELIYELISVILSTGSTIRLECKMVLMTLNTYGTRRDKSLFKTWSEVRD